jgi:hypothetical protein
MYVTSLKKIIEAEGTLIPIEYSSLPFEPKRSFIVKDVPKGEERGNHAHFNTQQLLICVCGKLLVKLFDGKSEESFVLEAGDSILVKEFVWDSQVYLTGNDIMLSICSTEYDPTDYINDIEEFKRLVTKQC